MGYNPEVLRYQTSFCGCLKSTRQPLRLDWDPGSDGDEAFLAAWLNWSDNWDDALRKHYAAGCGVRRALRKKQY